jgi:predicted DCC family thiol-disulfide oxidoreductase YuxK
MTSAALLPEAKRDSPDGLLVLFNGDCPVCRPMIEIYREISDASGQHHRWVDIAAEPASCAGLALDPAVVRRRLHVVGAGGRIMSGVDAMLPLLRRVPQHRRLARVLELPGIGALARLVYDRLLEPGLAAWNRHRAAPPRSSLYQRLLGARLTALPPEIRALREIGGSVIAIGRCNVERGSHPLAGPLGSLFGLPPEGRDIEVDATFAKSGDGEIWHRRFGAVAMRARHGEGRGRRRGLLVERVRRLAFAFRVATEGGRLTRELVAWRLCGLWLPKPKGLVIAGVESAEHGLFRFAVEMRAPLVGPLIRYSGWLVPVPRAANSSVDDHMLD